MHTSASNETKMDVCISATPTSTSIKYKVSLPCVRRNIVTVCWIPHGVHMEGILANPSHFSDTKAALDTLFLQVLLPLLLTGKKAS